MNRAHPVFSRVGCLSAVLVLAGVAAAMALRGGAIFSPGALTTFADEPAPPGAAAASHADIGHDCGQCHAPFSGIAAERCEACHTRVGQQRAAGTGLHGALAAARQCDGCHSDHRGPNFDPGTAALPQLDHETLAFSLARHTTDFAGQPMACQGCHHQADLAYEPAACLGCHAQADAPFMAAHGAAFGPHCLACHDGSGALSNFDHAQTGLPLDGGHAALACGDCHQPQAAAAQPARQCASCHAEPAVHAGVFGTQCAACHTTAAWAPARLRDHPFPLDHGGEGELACAACHTATYAAYACTDCHAHAMGEMVDEHAGEGIVGPLLLNCADCHPSGEKD